MAVSDVELLYLYMHSIKLIPFRLLKTSQNQKTKTPETFYNSGALFSHASMYDIPLLDSLLIWHTVAMPSLNPLLHLSKGENTTHNGQHGVTFKPGLQRVKDKEASILPKLQGPKMASEKPHTELFSNNSTFFSWEEHIFWLSLTTHLSVQNSSLVFPLS